MARRSKPHRRHPYPEPAARIVPVPFERGPLGQREQRVGEPVDTRHASERIVDRGRQRADGDLNHLRDAELAILGQGVVPADVNSTINRGLERADTFCWDNCCERFAAEHELAGAEPQHDQCVGRARGRDQRAVIDMLQVSALGAGHDGAGFGLAQNRGVIGCGAGALAGARHLRAAGRDV